MRRAGVRLSVPSIDSAPLAGYPSKSAGSGKQQLPASYIATRGTRIDTDLSLLPLSQSGGDIIFRLSLSRIRGWIFVKLGNRYTHTHTRLTALFPGLPIAGEPVPER